MSVIVGNTTTGTVQSSDRLKIPTGTSDPTTNLAVGDFYYNSSTKKYRIYNGSIWEDA